MKIVAFLGRSGSGKTTLIERLLPALAAGGLRVVVVKHAHHRGIELEPAGKDTRRFREAGAAGVALVAPDQVFTLEPRTSEPELNEILRRLPAADLALIESWKSKALPFVEVVGESGARIPENEWADGSQRIAFVGEHADRPHDVPQFARDAVAELAGFLRDWIRR